MKRSKYMKITVAGVRKRLTTKINFLGRLFLPLLYVLYKVLFIFLFERSFAKGELSYLLKEDFTIWKHSMCSMIKEYWTKGRYGFSRRKVVFSFCNSHIKIIRKTDPCDKNKPIVILCVKNDIRRIQMLVDHYREMGIVKFAILDNESNDGTFEWMLDQPDIDLYRCSKQYETNVKEGWINRLISYYGADRWYILTDSDELLVYQGMENNQISNLTLHLDILGVKRVKALTLDTYGKSLCIKESVNLRSDYRWIDSDSYYEVFGNAGSHRIKRYIGGPRYRLMNSKITLDKHPLVYWEKGTISDYAHYQFPHRLINDAPCMLGILHYKFINTDKQEYMKRASKGSSFAGKGTYYRQYMSFFDNQKHQSFMYEGSVEFTSSEVLKRIPFIECNLPN